MKQSFGFVILISCFYYGSSANLIKQFKGDSCEDQILPKPPCCGIGKESAARIVDGTEAEENEFPWMVNFGGCGGSLINSRWVLTAAHCIDANFPSIGYFGKKNCFLEACTKDVNIVKIKKRFAPKENLNLYLQYNFYDIALLQLEEPVTFSDEIKPICLPTAVNQYLGERKAVVSGWGSTRRVEKNSSPSLRKTTIEIWTPERCEQFGGYRYNLSSKYMICAGGESKTACNGDSGGPLFLKFNDEKNSESYYQVGIVSFGTRVCGIKGFPQVYTNVANYIKWIEDTILENQED